MKTTNVFIRRYKDGVIVSETKYVFKGNVSVIVNRQSIIVIEHEKNQKASKLELNDDETLNVRNW